MRPTTLIATALAIGCASASGRCTRSAPEDTHRRRRDRFSRGRAGTAAASVVAYIDGTFGCDALKRLLRATSTMDALTMLGTTEPALLEYWRASQR